MNTRRDPRRRMLEAEKARLMRRAERQRGRLHTQGSRVTSALPGRGWLARKIGLGGTDPEQETGPRIHPLLLGAAGLILPQLIKRHPVLRLAALGWGAYQLVSGENPRAKTTPRRRSLLRRFL
ncbi:MAG: hypothetical protein ACOY5H_06305 [Pseudomonadota bacterium]